MYWLVVTSKPMTCSEPLTTPLTSSCRRTKRFVASPHCRRGSLANGRTRGDRCRFLPWKTNKTKHVKKKHRERVIHVVWLLVWTGDCFQLWNSDDSLMILRLFLLVFAGKVSCWYVCDDGTELGSSVFFGSKLPFRGEMTLITRGWRSHKFLWKTWRCLNSMLRPEQETFNFQGP